MSVAGLGWLFSDDSPNGVDSLEFLFSLMASRPANTVSSLSHGTPCPLGPDRFDHLALESGSSIGPCIGHPSLLDDAS